jgi:hypothetical protein
LAVSAWAKLLQNGAKSLKTRKNGESDTLYGVGTYFKEFLGDSFV